MAYGKNRIFVAWHWAPRLKPIFMLLTIFIGKYEVKWGSFMNAKIKTNAFFKMAKLSLI